MLHLDIGMREHSGTLKEKECISLAYAIVIYRKLAEVTYFSFINYMKCAFF